MRYEACWARDLMLQFRGNFSGAVKPMKTPNKQLDVIRAHVGFSKPPRHLYNWPPYGRSMTHIGHACCARKFPASNAHSCLTLLHSNRLTRFRIGKVAKNDLRGHAIEIVTPLRKPAGMPGRVFGVPRTEQLIRNKNPPTRSACGLSLVWSCILRVDLVLDLAVQELVLDMTTLPHSYPRPG